jgi:hypothetical protein
MLVWKILFTRKAESPPDAVTIIRNLTSVAIFCGPVCQMLLMLGIYAMRIIPPAVFPSFLPMPPWNPLYMSFLSADTLIHYLSLFRSLHPRDKIAHLTESVHISLLSFIPTQGLEVSLPW